MRLFHLRARSFRTHIPFPGRLVSSLARFQYPLVGRVYALAFFISIERLLEPLSLNSSVVPIDDEVIDMSWSFPPDAHGVAVFCTAAVGCACGCASVPLLAGQRRKKKFL
jgi:hypothetical protein